MVGDVNGDSIVNIQDVVLIVDYVLGEKYAASGDLNADSVLNIQDIIQLVSII